MPLTVFYTSVSASREIKANQERITNVLDSKNIPYTIVDIAQDAEKKDLMRKISGNPTALPPQICNEDVYCGDYTAFDNAVEEENLEEFLKI
ncbi:SH3 domain-binding glutamic acid-rich-like protein 3 [Solea solea]|uniref:SH3 domain-binding glutamic acid-rich-like protein 3 n=1 Tax=Solea solea TaxID=90069 RepID=UPI002729D6E8|nr:SH3 domain-binding glutamic acid-rich-like protein 3 [Solea solea]